MAGSAAKRWRVGLTALLLLAVLVVLVNGTASNIQPRRFKSFRAAATASTVTESAAAVATNFSSSSASSSVSAGAAAARGPCAGTLWALKQLARCAPRRQRTLHCFNGYTSGLTRRSWNAFPHIRPMLLRAGYGDCLGDSRSHSVLLRPPASVEESQLLLVPNYWMPGPCPLRSLFVFFHLERPPPSDHILKASATFSSRPPVPPRPCAPRVCTHRPNPQVPPTGGAGGSSLGSGSTACGGWT